MVRKVHEVSGRKLRGELLGQDPGIGRPHPKGDEGADVPEDRMPDFVIELVEILVREDKADPVFAQLREHGGEVLRGEGLELIEVEEEVAAALLGNLGPRQAMQRKSARRGATPRASPALPPGAPWRGSRGAPSPRP